MSPDQRASAMTIGLIGRKVGMTQLFQDDGTMIPVSVLAVEPNTVTRVRTPERDGYTAVQLGIEESGKLTKPEIGQLKNLPMLAVLREVPSRRDGRPGLHRRPEAGRIPLRRGRHRPGHGA